MKSILARSGLASTLIVAVLAGCGQKGPLYLPPKPTPVQAPAPAPVPAAETAPASTGVPAQAPASR